MNRISFPGEKRPGDVSVVALSCRRLSAACCLAALWVMLLLNGGPVRAEDGYEGHILTVTEENDTGFSDRHYTQGARISYLSRDLSPSNCLDGFARSLPALGIKPLAVKWGLAIGQEVYTPVDIGTPNFIANDRPYAGYLYTGLLLQRRGTSGARTPVMETFEADLGIIGPESLAEQAQKWWHEVIKSGQPRGWRHQLGDEPAVTLRYRRQYLFALRDSHHRWGVDLIPAFGAIVGNVSTHASASGLLRAGYNIPNEFSVQPTEGAGKIGFYLFGGAEGRLVAYNAFLDGNLFRESHQIAKIPYVGDLVMGAALAISRHLELSLTHVIRSREFYRQTDHDEFSSGSVRVKF